MNIKEESRLKFGFPDDSKVIKFDDTIFYRKFFNKLPDSKGVDFITISKDVIALIEVKNCLGDEGNCRWRIVPNNQKRMTSRTTADVEGRNSLDIEIPQKVSMTLAALMGARSFGESKGTAEELKEIIESIFNESNWNSKRKMYVILFLEGDFGGHTRTKKMIMSELQRSMKVKLKWLNCKVSVVDSSTYNKNIFRLM